MGVSRWAGIGVTDSGYLHEGRQTWYALITFVSLTGMFDLALQFHYLLGMREMQRSSPAGFVTVCARKGLVLMLPAGVFLLLHMKHACKNST